MRLVLMARELRAVGSRIWLNHVPFPGSMLS